MRHLKIAIDIDGVVCDFITSFLRVLKEEHGLDMAREHIDTWELPVRLGLGPYEVLKMITKTHETGLAKPMPNAIAGIRKLTESHAVAFLTARPTASKRATFAWLAKHGLGGINVIWVGTKPKCYLVNYYKFDVMIDDSLEELMPVLDTSSSCRLIVLDQPWNQSYNLSGALMRAKDWNGILEIINTMAEGRR